uniref:Uncharacterized protein n=1 Tax=Anguilla anguilla TaxID=7936 RepID=A0A0E9V8S1_ANGAN
MKKRATEYIRIMKKIENILYPNLGRSTLNICFPFIY